MAATPCPLSIIEHAKINKNVIRPTPFSSAMLAIYLLNFETRKTTVTSVFCKKQKNLSRPSESAYLFVKLTSPIAVAEIIKSSIK